MKEITSAMVTQASQRAATTKLRLKKTLESGTATAAQIQHLQDLYEHQRQQYADMKKLRLIQQIGNG